MARPGLADKLTPPRIDSILHAGGEGMDVLVRRAESIARIEAYVREVLPEAIAGQTWAGNVTDGYLTLICRAPAFASRLRLESERILACLAGKGLHLKGLKVRINAHYDPPGLREPPARPIAMSAEVREEMRQVAREMGAEDGDPLAMALMKLANTAMRKQAEVSDGASSEDNPAR